MWRRGTADEATDVDRRQLSDRGPGRPWCYPRVKHPQQVTQDRPCAEERMGRAGMEPGD